MQGSAEPARRDAVTDQDQRRDAVDRAYRDHADDVYRVAFAILRDTEAAVDATQDTFARAFERWDQYDSNRSLRAWLHGIVSHAALDALRRRRVRRLAVPAVGRIGPVSGGGAWGADPSIGVARPRPRRGRPGRPQARRPCRARAPPLLRLRLRRDRRLPQDQSWERRLDPQPRPHGASCAPDHGRRDSDPAIPKRAAR